MLIRCLAATISIGLILVPLPAQATEGLAEIGAVACPGRVPFRSTAVDPSVKFNRTTSFDPPKGWDFTLGHYLFHGGVVTLHVGGQGALNGWERAPNELTTRAWVGVAGMEPVIDFMFLGCGYEVASKDFSSEELLAFFQTLRPKDLGGFQGWCWGSPPVRLYPDHATEIPVSIGRRPPGPDFRFLTSVYIEPLGVSGKVTATDHAAIQSIFVRFLFRGCRYTISAEMLPSELIARLDLLRVRPIFRARCPRSCAFVSKTNSGIPTIRYDKYPAHVYGERVLTAALRTMLHRGGFGWGHGTQLPLDSVTVVDGVAHVDFSGAVRRIWSTHEMAYLWFWPSLNKTVFQFRNIKEAHYTVNGKCSSFFIEGGCDPEMTPELWNASPFS